MKKLILVALSGMLFTCTYHSGPERPVTPISYPAPTHRNPNSIGILRRMAIMPIDVQPLTGQNNLEAEWIKTAMRCEEECAAYLRKAKGYEIVLARNSKSGWQEILCLEDGCCGIRQIYQAWRDAARRDRTLSMIRDIGHAMNVDGLIVMRIKEKRLWNAFDGIMNIFLMNIPLVYQLRAPNIGVWIYETASGRMIWRMEQSTFGDRQPSYPDILRGLFGEMENAVPLKLIK